MSITYLHGLDHTDVTGFEGVQRLHGCLQGRHSFSQIAFTLILNALSYSCSFTGYCFICCYHLQTHKDKDEDVLVTPYI